MRTRGIAAAALAVALGVVAVTPSPRAQTAPPPRVAPDLEGSAARVPGRAVPPLDGSQTRRLLHAQAMRETGQAAAARETLLALLTEKPHHPLVLGELARLHMVQQQWSEVERLAVGERAATRDSVLLARELALAYERLLEPRRAAETALSAWVASPAEREWAEATLMRLEDVAPRAARDVLRRAAESQPDRADLGLAAARLEWRSGDAGTALRLLAATDATGPGTPVRWSFAHELLVAATARDTSGAIEALLGLAADAERAPAYRLSAARRAWQVYGNRDARREGALRISRALTDLPAHAWARDLLVDLARGLRETGQTTELRALLERLGDRRSAFPELALEEALNDLRDGPPARVLGALEKAAIGSPEGVFRYAEALFFAGMPDSAMTLYQLLSHDAGSPYTAPALERLFLIEDAEPRTALPALGRMAYEAWRGERGRALALAESLHRALPRGPLWASVGLELSGYRERDGDAEGALLPLLAVADSLPGDRLAPLARQRAGDIYRLRLADDARALSQYEECLARYPKAWNAPEVRRVLETLRRERRF